jgi:hypothetical protein
MSLTLDGSASVTINSGAILGITSGTVKDTSTGATSYDFTGIPSWVKRITVMFSGISLSGTSIIQTQLGTSGGIQSTSYNGAYIGGTNAGSVSGGSLSSGIPTGMFQTAAALHYGQIIISLLDSATGTWAYSGVSTYPAGNNSYMIAGTKVLSGTLTQVRITSVNGTDTFDAGSINILYE